MNRNFVWGVRAGLLVGLVLGCLTTYMLMGGIG